MLLYVLPEGDGKFTARLTNAAAGRACLLLKALTSIKMDVWQSVMQLAEDEPEAVGMCMLFFCVRTFMCASACMYVCMYVLGSHTRTCEVSG